MALVIYMQMPLVQIVFFSHPVDPAPLPLPDNILNLLASYF
jgi:hypothetical protein